MPALRLSTAVRNARLDAIESTTGASAKLRVYDNSAGVPGSCIATATGVVLAEINLPSDWMNNASGGSKTISGTWQTLSALATGTAAYFRIWDNAVAVCHLQGLTGATGSGEDMELSSVTFAIGQSFTVTTFTLTDANS